MAVDESVRYRMHQKLDQLMGADDAAALMAHLPPLGWGDVATKADLALTKAELRAEMGALEARLLGQMNVQTRTILLGTLGMNVTMAAAIIAAVGLSG